MMPRIDEFKLLADVCRQSLAQFVREFWFVVNPGNPIQWNFHVEHMCSEVQAVYERVFAKKPKLYDLVYNISPGTSKSTVFSIMAPAWAWTRMPHFCFIGASYSEELAWELAGKNRDVVKSELYQKCFPDIKIRSDQDSLSKFVNTKMGYRYAVGSNTNVTGKHGDLLGVDDPINPKQVLSEATLWGVNHWLRNTLNSRVKDKTISAMTMVMQRLHQDDPTAQMIRRKRVRHVCLPATTEFPIKPPELKKFYKDGLMDPVRLPQEYLDEERSPFAMGEAGYATQFGQSPTPIGGSMFRVDKLKWGRPPEQFKRLVRFWDKAASISSGNNPKSRGPAFTVGTKMGLDLEDRLWVLDVDRRRLDSFDRERLIKRTALRDGKECEVGQEQEPGSGGKDQALNTVKRLIGFRVRTLVARGSKEVRADEFSVQVNAGNVYLPEELREGGSWIGWAADFVDELRHFPFSTYKDIVDSSSGAVSLLVNRPQRCGALRRKQHA